MSNFGRISSVVWVLLVMLIIGALSCADEERVVRPSGPGDVRFYKVSGDDQDCLPFDTLPNRMVVKVDRGDDYPLRSVYLTFTLKEGNGQVAGKPTDSQGVLAVNVPTDALGFAYIQYQAFAACQAVVKGSIDTIPGLALEFTINPGPPCTD